MVDLMSVRKAWERAWGPDKTRQAMGSAWKNSFGAPPLMALDSAFSLSRRGGRDQEEPVDPRANGTHQARVRAQRDQEQEEPDPRIAKAQAFLKSRLGPEVYAQFCALLSGEEDGEAQDDPSGGGSREQGSHLSRVSESVGL